MTHIGFNLPYARQFFQVPNVGFNMFQKVLVGPYGNSFIKDAKKAKRAILVWTVDEEQWMLWSIRKQLDGVITNDPKKYLEVCDNYDESAPAPTLSVKSVVAVIWINSIAFLFGMLFSYRHGFKIKTTKTRYSPEKVPV